MTLVDEIQKRIEFLGRAIMCCETGSAAAVMDMVKEACSPWPTPTKPGPSMLFEDDPARYLRTRAPVHDPLRANPSWSKERAELESRLDAAKRLGAAIYCRDTLISSMRAILSLGDEDPEEMPPGQSLLRALHALRSDSMRIRSFLAAREAGDMDRTLYMVWKYYGGPAEAMSSQTMRTCTNCGHEERNDLANGALTCPACGFDTVLGVPGESAVEDDDPPAVPPPAPAILIPPVCEHPSDTEEPF